VEKQRGARRLCNVYRCRVIGPRPWCRCLVVLPPPVIMDEASKTAFLGITQDAIPLSLLSLARMASTDSRIESHRTR